MKASTFLTPTIGLLACLATGRALAQACPAPLPPDAGVPPTSINPVIVRPLATIITPVAATDGLVHLAYAAQVTSLASGVTDIEAITPVDATSLHHPTGQNLVLDVDEKPITGKVRLFGKPPDDVRDSATLAAGGSGITFFDITYSRLADVPRLLLHQVAVRLPGNSRVATLSDPQRVGCAPPVRLSPPLEGHGWWNGNGCCRTVNAHRSATLPLNGDLRVPEQFAIDFMQFRADSTCCTGPVKDLKSWPFYGAPVLAAAAGRVVEASDDQNDQVPGPPEGVNVTNAAGNHVIQQIGPSQWILYAHLRPHTVAVRAGQMLQPGQRLGEVGNSGSTTAPHLHFQVMDRPSALNATGLPFVFDRQRLEGRVSVTPAQAELDYEAGRPVRVDRQTAALHLNEMPAEGQVFGFRLN